MNHKDKSKYDMKVGIISGLAVSMIFIFVDGITSGVKNPLIAAIIKICLGFIGTIVMLWVITCDITPFKKKLNKDIKEIKQK